MKLMLKLRFRILSEEEFREKDLYLVAVPGGSGSKVVRPSVLEALVASLVQKEGCELEEITEWQEVPIILEEEVSAQEN